VSSDGCVSFLVAKTTYLPPAVPDNSTIRTLRHAIPDLTQERRYRGSERGGEVGEEGGGQVVPQRRSCVLGIP
jgi:hypothetical protein